MRLRPAAALLILALVAPVARADVGEALVPLLPHPAGVAWPTRAWPTAEPAPGVDRGALDAAFARAFATETRGGLKHTRALLVVHRGAIVAERYAPGFGPESRFHSWSMAKSVTQALAGLLVREGRLDLAAPAGIPEWQDTGDPRAALTLGQLLHMNTGLGNDDEGQHGGGPLSFVANLIFGAGAADQAAFAAAPPARHPPGTHWAYSTATSTLVASLVQREVGGDARAMLAFMRRALFEPLGMRSVVPEFDAAGTFMGGGFVWASARDWARFGYLYLRDGTWDGRRLLPEGWVDYTRTPAPAENNGVYGAHFWLNREPVDDQFRILPGGPTSVFSASGAYGQFVLIAPGRDLVVVRLGEMDGDDWDGLKAPLADVIAAFPTVAGGTRP